MRVAMRFASFRSSGLGDLAMPFIQRDAAGKITGLYVNPQPGYAEEVLPDDDPQVIAFRTEHPIPTELLAQADSRTEAKEIRRLMEDTKRIREAIFNMIFAWANLENELSLLLGALLQERTMALSSAIYFAPPSTETRLAIVSATLRMALGGSPHFAKIEAAWTRFVASFGRKKGVRNQVAHGQIVTVAMNGKNTARLTSPAFDFSRIAGSVAKKQLPGLGPNEIEQSASAVVRLSGEVTTWLAIVAAFYAADDATLLQKLAELPANQST